MRLHLKGILALLIVTSAIIAVLIIKIISPVGLGKKDVEFTVPTGAGSKQVAAMLEEKNLIRNAFVFRIFLLLNGKGGDIKRGTYPLSNGLSMHDIIQVITEGHTKLIKLTIPEGYNNRQIASLLYRKNLVKGYEEFVQAEKQSGLIEKYKIPAKTLEGYLFPETYFLPHGYPIKKILNIMVKTFFEKVGTLEGFPKDPRKRHEIITLASIVEKEAKVKEERALIAGVFLNRLKENYPLESCATVQYLFDKPKKRLLYRHLRIKSPYNTYQIKGLPPHPIASPGFLSLQAAFKPKNTNFKYFVVKGDGRHKFSRTLAEHEIAKEKYIRFLR